MIRNRRMHPENLEQVFANKRKDKGLLIAIIGFDGAGKTTQIDLISSEIKSWGYEVIVEIEPTNWFRKQPLNRSFLEEGGSVETARVLALMAAADRIRHVNEVIRPALERGAVVICDRYVYAAFGVFIHRGIPAEFIAEINSGIPEPDYAFFLDVHSEELYKRLVQRDGSNLKFEEKSIESIESIVKTYREMEDKLIQIDGTKEANIVAQEIVDIIKKSRYFHKKS